MIDINNWPSWILLFVFFFLPGFVSLKVWSLFYRQGKIEYNVFLYDCLFFSVTNLGILSPIVVPFLMYVDVKSHPALVGLFILLYSFVAPMLWPCCWHWLINRKLVYKFLELPYPTAWDYFIHQRKCCFVLIHLKDDNMIGGYYGRNSYASTSPDEQSIYLERVFKVNADGTFAEEVPDSFGLVISKTDYKYIEFFYESQEQKNGQGRDKQER